jgi:hypothetical protein
VEWIISEEKHYRGQLLERAKHHEEKLHRSRMTGLQKELTTLKFR